MNFKLVFFLSFFSVSMFGQSMDDFFISVLQSNPQIIAHRKLLEARKIEAKTGIAPPDPFVTASYMPGQGQTPGDMKTWEINQSFSFPSKYLLQKKVNASTILLAEQEFRLGSLQILLDAELTLFDLIYNTKMLSVISERKTKYDSLLSAWKKMLDNGAATILDYNRILIELSGLNLEIMRITAQVGMLHEHLKYLSGSDIFLSINEYPAISDISIERIIEEKISSHPAYLIPELEYQLSLQNVKLIRSGSLPEIQVGYGSEVVPGENYAGPIGGISVPLWTNSNKVKAAAARAEYSASLRDANISKLVYGARNEYSNLRALQTTIDEIRNTIDTEESKRLLEKSFDSGEISLNTYFSYLESLFESEDRYLKAQNELYRSLAVLTDQNLLEP